MRASAAQPLISLVRAIMCICSYCTSVSQSNEISQLSTIINNLNMAVTSLTETVKSLQSSISIQPSLSNSVSQVDGNLPHPLDGTNSRLISQSQGTPRFPQMAPDRKFNVVIYGIQEFPSNTPKEIRLKNELNCLCHTLSDIDGSLNSSCIHDFQSMVSSTLRVPNLVPY